MDGLRFEKINDVGGECLNFVFFFFKHLKWIYD